MTEMFRSLLVVSILVAAPRWGEAAQQTRYTPAPAGKPYLMFSANGAGFSTFTTAETVDIAEAGPYEYDMKSSWGSSWGELGVTIGYGTGSLPLLKATDLSVYLPFGFRSYDLSYYLADEEVAFGSKTLHESLREEQAGKGFGDMEFSGLALVYAGGGTYVTGGVGLTLPTGTSSHERFVGILHGTPGGPGVGAGTMQITPRVAGMTRVGRQIIYANLQYALPLGEDAFEYVSPTDEPPGGTGTTFYTDSGVFQENVKLGGTFQGTLGVQTSLDVWGISPAVELSLRRTGKATWTENGRDGAEFDSGAAHWYPTHAPEFLQAAAWSVGNLALRDNVEVEIGVVGSMKVRKQSEMVKFGVSYITNSFGQSVGFKVAYMSMFIARSKEEMPEPEGMRAEEVEVSPVLAAPAAPAGRVRIGIGFPTFSAGMSQEQAAWVKDRLRDELKRRRSYALLPEEKMAHLAYTPCGDSACGTQFGRALTLQGMIVCRLERIGDPANPATTGYAMTLQMINVANADISYTETVSAVSLQDLAPQIPGIVSRMAGEDR